MHPHTLSITMIYYYYIIQLWSHWVVSSWVELSVLFWLNCNILCCITISVLITRGVVSRIHLKWLKKRLQQLRLQPRNPDHWSCPKHSPVTWLVGPFQERGEDYNEWMTRGQTKRLRSSEGRTLRTHEQEGSVCCWVLCTLKTRWRIVGWSCWWFKDTGRSSFPWPGGGDAGPQSVPGTTGRDSDFAECETAVAGWGCGLYGWNGVIYKVAQVDMEEASPIAATQSQLLTALLQLVVRYRRQSWNHTYNPHYTVVAMNP